MSTFAPARMSGHFQQHDDRVLLVLGVVIRPDADRSEGEAPVEPLRDGVRAPDLQGHAAAVAPAGDVHHVRQQPRGVSGVPVLRVGGDVQDVQLVRDQPVVGEGGDLAADHITQDVDAGPIASQFLQEHVPRPGRAKGKAFDLHHRVDVDSLHWRDGKGLRGLADRHQCSFKVARFNRRLQTPERRRLPRLTTMQMCLATRAWVWARLMAVHVRWHPTGQVRPSPVSPDTSSGAPSASRGARARRESRSSPRCDAVSLSTLV